jgi:NTP pyrophosphatase (non-canonical NTP hydrolase)
MRKFINELVNDAHENAVAKGWWQEERSFGEIIALIHSEASEALEDFRNGYDVKKVWYEREVMLQRRYDDPSAWVEDIERHVSITPEGGKPCGIPSELADIVIRVFDACGRYGIDLEAAIAEKMAYNATRPERHGGKVL